MRVSGIYIGYRVSHASCQRHRAPRRERSCATRMVDSRVHPTNFRSGSRVPMLGAAVAIALRSAAGESHRFAWSVGGAIRRFRPLPFRCNAMIEPVIRPRARRGTRRPRILRAAPLRVRAWTGRSAVSSATDTQRPRIATAGTGRTRVSVARLSRSRLQRMRTSTAHTQPVISLRKRRSPSHPRLISG